MSTDTSTATRICSGCFRDLPLAEFRIRNRAKGTRHSACRECRTGRDRWTRGRHRRSLTRRELTELRRARSAELLLNLVDSVIHRLGGTERFVTQWLGLVAEGQPTLTRIKALETLMHALTVAD